ncbi:hypothetical protein COV94_01770, partial [Candidatus Woesearchaeota archaeon CG11_big_fil_rev_8_21_14_0_20_57_5]
IDHSALDFWDRDQFRQAANDAAKLCLNRAAALGDPADCETFPTLEWSCRDAKGVEEKYTHPEQAGKDIVAKAALLHQQELCKD